jgi:hypothetical protein
MLLKVKILSNYYFIRTFASRQPNYASSPKVKVQKKRKTKGYLTAIKFH